MRVLNYRIRDKTKFLLAVMNELADDSRISFEGDLSSFHLFNIDGASCDETLVLRRNTISPKQDFVTLPLRSSTVQDIITAIGGSVSKKILHIQVEKSGRLEFGAYDNFHEETMGLGDSLGGEFVGGLLKADVIGTRRKIRH